MRALLWFLGLAGLAVGLALAARGNQGYALIVWPPYRIELTLNLLLVALALAFTVFYFFFRLVSRTRALPARVRAYRAERRREKAAVAFQESLRLYFEGRYGHAIKRADEAYAGGYAPGLAALLAARSAHAMRELEKEQGWLTQAGGDASVAAARLMCEAELAIASRRFDDALAALQRVQKISGRHIAALRLELKAQQGLRAWDEVLRLTRLLLKRDAMLPEQARELTLRAHRENLRQRAGDRRQLAAYRKHIPADELNPRLVALLAENLFAAGDSAAARELIETQLDSEWDSDLVRLYAAGHEAANGDEAQFTAAIARAEAWLKQYPRDPELLLALGRLCLKQRLWGKAQSYLEASLSLSESHAAHLELAQLSEQLGRESEADRHYRIGASLGNRRS